MPREMVRQGGRSARIQEAVHRASRDLLGEMDRAAITVPLIAARSGVTPSTIYRRWGTLGELLADVAVERLRPASEPDDTGSTYGDLEVFVLQYAEEMASDVGRALLRDVVADAGGDGEGAPTKCCQFTYDNLETISARAVARGEKAVDVEAVMDRVIAPICYHILFSDRAVGPDYCRKLMRGTGESGTRATRATG